jgi:O-antigen/teichoic acid export membrane protein
VTQQVSEEAPAQPTPNESEEIARGPVTLPLKWLARGATGKHALALVDQTAVSGTSFLTTVLVGRWCGAEELGVYSLAFSLAVAWGCVQEALVALPYIVYHHRQPLGTREQYAGSVLVLQWLLSLVALAALAVAAVALSGGGAVPGLGRVLWALAAVTPLTLLRDFARRFAFAHLRMAEALVLDLAVAGVQLLALVWLAWAGGLSAATAYLALGVACAGPVALWLYLTRRSFDLRGARVGQALRLSWSLGKWQFAAQLTLTAQGYFIHWLLAWTVGEKATGVYAACMTVALFANPLILAAGNALMPRAAQARAEGGGAALRRVVGATTLLLAGAMALFVAAVALAGERVMALLYRGEYAGHGPTLTVLALAMLVSALGLPAANGLAALERTDVVFKTSAAALALSVLLVPVLVARWGVAGAAYGFLAGNLAGAGGRCVGFAVLAPMGPGPTTRVLGERGSEAEEGS